jgi:hypothetical protein
MRHHIMLLFLSDVKTRTPRDEDGKPLDKELLPFAVYKQGIGECGITNESAVRYLRDLEVDGKRLELDALFAFASKMVQQPIGVPNSSIVPFERTHLEFFKERVAPVLPRIDEDGFFQIVSYDEKQRIPETRRFVLEMAERIMAYVQEKKAQGDEVVLHADLTGGLRHAVMLMLAVMRLLQYNGIEIGKVLYSNYQAKIVEEANDIYRLFDLIAGADEFAQFGSVSAILRYFGYDKIPVKKPEHISTRLHNLLVAMHGFAEEIKVCHYGAFAHAVKALSKALHDFRVGREADDADVNEGMIAQLRFRIMAEYGDILGDKIDDVKLLRWCVNHGYLQQALTLFTERVPEILKARDVVALSPAFESKVRADMKKDDKRSTIFYFFAEYGETKGMGEVDSFLDHAKKAYRKIMQTIMADALDGKEGAFAGEEGWKAQLHERVAEEAAVQFWPERAYGSLNLENEEEVHAIYVKLLAWSRKPEDFKGKDPQEALWKNLVDALCEAQIDASAAADEAAKQALKEAWREAFRTQQYGGKKLKRLATFIRNNMKADDADAVFSNVSLRPGTKGIFSFRNWAEQGEIDCRLSSERIYPLLDIYYELKAERNQSNHAREDSAPGGARKLEKLFKEAFRLLEKL